MTHAPEIAVIIPHYNDVTRLDRCLSALVVQVGPDIEVVVVDNQSDEDLTDVITKYPEVRFYVEPQKGPGLARNRGVLETSAATLAFLDSDCVPTQNWLETARGLVGKRCITGGRVEIFDETPPPRSGAEAFETVFAFNQVAYLEHQNFLVTANMIMPRDVFQGAGPFVPSAVPEDLEWCQRAVSKGYSLVYFDDLRVWHPSRQDWSALEKKWRRLTYQGYVIAREDGMSRLAWALRAALMPASVVVHAPRVLVHPKLGRTDKLRSLGALLRLRLARMGWMLRQAATGKP